MKDAPVRTLPAFARMGEVYDLLMSDVPYARWVAYLVEIFERMRHRPTRILDLGCGTGTAARMLVERGFPVVGLDGSRSMLDTAKTKSNADFPLIQADFRALPFRDRAFSTVFSMFDSINNLLTPEDLQRAFREVFRVLAPGGLFTFDVNTPWVLEHFWGDDEKVKEIGNTVSIWRTEYDARKKRSRLWITVFVPTPVPGLYERLDEVHQEQGYELSELREHLEAAGFREVRMFRHLSFRPARTTDNRVQVVARRDA